MVISKTFSVSVPVAGAVACFVTWRVAILTARPVAHGPEARADTGIAAALVVAGMSIFAGATVLGLIGAITSSDTPFASASAASGRLYALAAPNWSMKLFQLFTCTGDAEGIFSVIPTRPRMPDGESCG